MGNAVSPTAVGTVTAADGSIVIAGTATAPTVATGTLDVVAAQHPPVAAVAMNSQKITSLATPTANTDAATKAYADSAGFASPMTTLGDMIVENATPAAARLAGSTSATKNWLSQTGNGTISALPAWATIGAADVPALNALTAPTADLSLNSKKITNLATPTVSTDAVTKAYADGLSAGLSVKASVQEATTAALPANTYLLGVLTGTSTGVLTVDGQTVALNDRVLVKNEAAQANNGIYTCTTAGAGGVAYVLTRSTDMNTGAEVPGAFCFVELGTVNAATGWVVAGAGPYTLGVTAIVWTQFGSGAVSSVTATDASIVVSGSGSAPTIATGVLNNIATQHPPTADWSNNSKKITSLANGSAASDAAAFGQIPTLDATAADIRPDGTQAAGAVGKAADSGHGHQERGIQSLLLAPTTFGPHLAETFARNTANAVSGTLTSGTLYLTAIALFNGCVVTNVNIAVNAFSSGITHGWGCLLDASGVVKAVSADKTSGNFPVSGNSADIGQWVMGTPYTVTAEGLFYIGIMIVASVQPTVFYKQASATNLFVGAHLLPLLSCTGGTSLTTPPALAATQTLTGSGTTLPFYGTVS